MAGQRRRHHTLANRNGFPAADPLFRQMRTNCASACRIYNNQSEDTSPKERANLWHAITASSHDPIQQVQTSHISSSHPGETHVDHQPDPAIRKPLQNLAVYPNNAPIPNPSPTCLDEALESGLIGSRLGLSAPQSFSLHSPPPSPIIPQVSISLPEKSTGYLLVNTPPPSRRASLPFIFIGETPPSAAELDVVSEALKLDVLSKSASAEPKLSNPFVGVPYVKPPCYIDYGSRLDIAPSTFINRNFTVIDSPVSTYSIGERCLLGPNVTLAGVEHPLDAAERGGPLGAPSYASDIVIGNDCWLGAGVIVLGGVSIGDGAVIGAGSVVTRNIPAGYLALGVPARVIRKVSFPHDACALKASDAHAVACQDPRRAGLHDLGVGPTPSLPELISDVELMPEFSLGLPSSPIIQDPEFVGLRDRVSWMERVISSLCILILVLIVHATVY